MALDYYKVEPDRIALLGKHFTPGSMNRNIQYITRHHTAGVLDADALNRVWDTRPASTHYLADPKGIVSQHVWDKDVAWSNGNSASNAVTLTIEHANSAGAGSDWPISDATIIAGARWAAALCLYYKLGRPKFGTNIRDHRNFTQTSCPYHLANGGKYHQKWLDEAQRFYDALVSKTVHPDGTPINPGTPAPAPAHEGESMFGPEQVAALHDAKVAAQEAREVLDGEYASLINPQHSFTLAEYATLIDAATWEQRKLSEAIAKKLGLDPDTIIEEAIKADRGEL